jgi:hypothetical protein
MYMKPSVTNYTVNEFVQTDRIEKKNAGNLAF